MKKILVFALALICLLGITLSLGAAQTATVGITPNKSSTYAGDSVTFTVKVTGVSAAKSIGIIPSYDTSVFELVSGEWLLSGSAMSDFSGGTAAIAYASARGFNENVFKFTLRIKSGAKLGQTAVDAKVNIMNGNETISCNVSAAKVTVACKHSYSAWSNANGSSHTRTCSLCKNVETKNHTFSNACDTSCNDCSYTRVTNHTYSSSWSSDGAQHWHACTGCGDKKDATVHTPGPAATETTDQTCTVCGHVLVSAQGHTHTPSATYTSDETGHWFVCEGCKEPLEKAEHIFSADCDEACDACQYKRTVTHTYGTEWYGDEQSHWHVCSICNSAEASEAHAWDEGTVTKEPTLDFAGERVHKCATCERQKTVELILQSAPTQDPTPAPITQNDGLAWWWLIIVGTAGIALGFAAAFLLFKPKKEAN
ncbi:MAG: hypothetical protein J6C26_02510 [Clostridia bacterium]|nr:hypothetical protein [Clostridia bacterium]